MVRDWRLIPPKLTKKAWNSLINDFVELAPYYVKKADGNDLLETINAYQDERTICMPPGIYIPPEQLVIRGFCDLRAHPAHV
jgi:hypothetical protein